jgi:hypothetical protein
VSDAEPRPIVVVSKPLFWSLTIGMIALVASASVIAERRAVRSRNSAPLSAYHR